MEIGYNNSPISFAANHRIYFFHFFHHVHFTNSGWMISTSMLYSNFFKRFGAAHIAHGISSFSSKHIICDSNQRKLFTEHASIFTNKTKPVDIRIYRDTKSSLSFLYFCTEPGKIFRQWLRVMRKPARYFSIQKNNVFNTQRIKQRRNEKRTR